MNNELPYNFHDYGLQTIVLLFEINLQIFSASKCGFVAMKCMWKAVFLGKSLFCGNVVKQHN